MEKLIKIIKGKEDPKLEGMYKEGTLQRSNNRERGGYDQVPLDTCMNLLENKYKFKFKKINVFVLSFSRAEDQTQGHGFCS